MLRNSAPDEVKTKAKGANLSMKQEEPNLEKHFYFSEHFGDSTTASVIFQRLSLRNEPRV